MKAWPTDCRQRATAYLTDPAGRLLVFDHVGNPGSGTQVPAGGMKPGERAEDAALRELVEESGVENAVLVRKLGETWSVTDPVGSAEQIQHAFHLRVEEPPLEQTWEWDECSGGAVALHRFALRWATLDEAALQLWPIQAMWLEPLRLSLRQDAAIGPTHPVP